MPPFVRAGLLGGPLGTLTDMQIQLGRGDDATGVIVTEPTRVEQRMIVTMVQAGDWAVELTAPLTLTAGDLLWIRGATIYVRRPNADPIRHEGEGLWLCR